MRFWDEWKNTPGELMVVSSVTGDEVAIRWKRKKSCKTANFNKRPKPEEVNHDPMFAEEDGFVPELNRNQRGLFIMEAVANFLRMTGSHIEENPNHEAIGRFLFGRSRHAADHAC